LVKRCKFRNALRKPSPARNHQHGN
jgi:hypothetical protein